MHAARLRIDPHVFAQHAVEPRRGDFTSLGIEPAHPLNMAREMPFRDELGDDRLRKLGTAARESLHDLLESLYLAFRHDQIREPETRKQNLAEGAGIKHSPDAIQAF